MESTAERPDAAARRRRRRVLVVPTAILLALAVLWPPLAPSLAVAGDDAATPAVGLPADAPWTWPAEGAHRVETPFRAPAHRYGPGHRGMDIAAAGPIRSPADGVIAFRGTVVDRGVLTIDHGDGYVITLEPVTSDFAPGDVVEAGQVIAQASTGGHAASGTVHVGVRRDGEYVNPRPLFGEIPRAILYPCCAGG